MSTWAGIIRISHLGDRKIGSDSLHSDRSQEKAIRNAVPPGHTLDLLAPEYDVSGGLPLEQRPALLAAVRGVEAGRYAGIIVAYQSRLFRNTVEEEAVFGRVEQAGGEIIMALDPVDNKTVDGRMVRRIKSAMNVAERERHAEAFDERCREATARGVWQRRQVPRGYTKDPATRRLTPGSDAPRVRKAFADRLAGEPVSRIARDLGMTLTGARHLLANRVYLGELRVRSYVNPTAHPAIVDPDVFEAVQAARPARPPKARAHRSLLASLVRCSGCGHMMTRNGAKNSSGGSYSCKGLVGGQPCPAPASIGVDRLNAHVEQVALPELASLYARSVKRAAHIPALRQAVRDAERELAAYLDAVQAAGLQADTFAAGARKRQDAIDAARGALAAALAAQPPSIAANAAELWPRLNDSQRNHLLCGLLEAVVVRRVGSGRVVPVADRVRIVLHGAGVFAAYRGGEAGLPVRACWPDADDPFVLGVQVAEDAFEGGGG